MTKRKKIIIIVPSVIFSLLIGGIFFVNEFISTDKFKEMLTGTMEKQLQAKVNIDQWEASVFSGFHFTNLSVDQPEGFGSEKLLKTDRFTMKFNFWDLLSKKITLSEIAIDGLNVNLNQNSKGLWFFQTLFPEENTVPEKKTEDEKQKAEKQEKPDKKTSPVNNLIILAETIKIKNANFLAKDQNGNLVGELKNANIDGKIDIHGSKSKALLNLNSSAITLSNIITGFNDNISVKNLEVNVKIDENKADIQNLSLEIFSGTIKTRLAALNYQGDQPEIDMDIQINNLNPAPVLAIAGQPEDMLSSPLACNVSAKLKIESLESFKKAVKTFNKHEAFGKDDQNTLPVLCGLLDNINNLDANLKLDMINAKNILPGQYLSINKIDCPVRIEKRTITLNGLSLDIFGGSLLTSLTADIGTESVGLKGDIQTKNIDSAPLLVLAEQEKEMVDGPLNAHITFEGSIKNPLALSAETIENADLSGSVSLGEIVTKPAGKIDSFNLSYKLLNGNVIISPLLVKAYNGEIRVVLKADKLQSAEPLFDTNVTIHNLDGTTLLKSIGQDHDLISGNLNVKLTAKGTGKTLETLNIESLLEIGSITAMKDVRIDQITVPLKLEKGELTIEPIVKAFKGELKTRMKANNITNVQPDSAGDLPTFEMQTSISNMDFGALLKVCDLDTGMIKGPLNMNITAKGKGNSMANLETTALINIPGVNVEIAKTVVNNIKGQLQFANQKALIKDFTADIYGGKISMFGSYDLPNETYASDLNFESLGIDKAMEGFVKDIKQVKHLIDTTKVMTGTVDGKAKVAGSSANFDILKGDFDLRLKNGIIGGHPIQIRLSDVLNRPELDNIEFSHIDMAGSIDGMIINLDSFDLESRSISLNATKGVINIKEDTLLLPIEIGVSPEIASKLDKPVPEIQYSLKKKEDGLYYLPPFEITGSMSKPNIKKALVEVLTKSVAKGFVKKELFDAVGVEQKIEPVKDTEVKEETKETKKTIFDTIGGLFGGEKKDEEKDKEVQTEKVEAEKTEAEKEDEKKSPQQFIKGLFGF